MRLHRLQVQAFGPFAETVTVDLDELSEAGLFLLSGATGAGKTSVLDAVCFALYGDVPGDRGTAKRLRCDQADPATPPRVELDATLAGRRFHIVRSPAWERPKKRGTGTTTAPASVTVSELVGGQERPQHWQTLSSRLDEAGDLVVRLLGMNLTQFTQVAMLPQGRFQTFLRARSDDRHRLLQQLFRTERFERVEQWLREHRLGLARDDDTHHQRAADLVSRVSEVTGEALPDGCDAGDLAPCVEQGQLERWVHDLRGRAEQRRQEAAMTAEQAGRAECDARTALDRARDLVERRRRLDRARVEQQELEGATAAHQDDRRRLQAARRAAAVVPLQRVAESATDAERVADERAEQAEAQAHRHGARLPGPDDHPDLGEAAEHAAVLAARAQAAMPRSAKLAEIEHELTTLATRQQTTATDLATAREQREPVPAALDRARTAVDEARAAAAGLDRATAQRDEVAERLAAAHRAEQKRTELEEARRTWLGAREQMLARRDELVTLRQTRIEGIAAELAADLAAGCSCPVCGSAEHPHKASPTPGAPDAAAEKAAQAAVDDAAAVEAAHDQQVRELEAAVAAATAHAGDRPPEQLSHELAEHRAACDSARRAAASCEQHQQEVERLEEALADLGRRIAGLDDEQARLETRHETLEQDAAGLRSEVEEVLAGSGHHDLTELLAEHRTTERSCREALERGREADAAAASRAAAEQRLTEAATAAGFAGPEEAAQAAVESPELEALEARVTDHERRLAAVAEVLDEPGAEQLRATALPDVDALEQAHAEALDHLTTTRGDVRHWSDRSRRLHGLSGELDAVLGAWAPVREGLSVATALSSFVEGKATDNALRMRLSAYVLAYRLSQVVAAANHRLARMSDRRYSLEHTGHKGAGETRGGLSLLVRDDWSGESRDPATLSGGETFVVSLALALGLADVIAHEAGGAALDTLFVDEGFGSLDAETLDDVMDTLDSLRDGGRVVGVVSHVSEIRDRIPVQLQVTKSPRGSTVSMRR